MPSLSTKPSAGRSGKDTPFPKTDTDAEIILQAGLISPAIEHFTLRSLSSLCSKTSTSPYPTRCKNKLFFISYQALFLLQWNRLPCCKFSLFGNNRKLSGHGPGQSGVGSWTGIGPDRPESPFQPQPVILWTCSSLQTTSNMPFQPLISSYPCVAAEAVIPGINSTIKLALWH